MIVTIDTEKDFRKIKELVLNLPSEELLSIENEIKRRKGEQYKNTLKEIETLMKNSGIPEGEALAEIKIMRQEKRNNK